MNNPLKLLILLILVFSASVSNGQNHVPFLQTKGNTTQLIIEGKPFIMRGGELGNSSSSTMLYMQTVWPKLKAMHLNTVLVPVYWDLVENEKGKFDFSLIRQLITEARDNRLKIVFLWFASWKNSMSCYAPAWVKLDQNNYPRIKDDKGRSHEILTPFSENNLQADENAFVKLMGFIKDFDKEQQTVIMIQVENEIGMLPTARDYSPQANAAFQKDIPQELIRYLQQHKDKLVPELSEAWKENGFKTSGNWQQVFGKSLYTDEIFMAWYYSKYANSIAEAGKKVYPLPMYVNAALNRPGRKPGSGYPSAGPLPQVMDVWKAAGSSIDLLEPDIYFPDFKHWADLYVRQGDPLFIPEHRFDNTAAPKALYAYGHYHALGFSPFSIESTDKPDEEPIGKVYNLVAQLTPIITSDQRKIEGVLFDKEHPDTVINMGKYAFTCRHDYTLGWTPGAKADEWLMTGAIIIQTGDNDFYMAGTGVVITVKPLDDSLNAGILNDEEGTFENNQWQVIRYLSGDQTHQGRHLRIPVDRYSIQKFSLYIYK